MTGIYHDLRQFILQFLRRLHRHRWADSRLNAYALPTEQTCHLCGARRHKTIDEALNNEWRDGPHPLEPAYKDLVVTGGQTVSLLGSVGRKPGFAGSTIIRMSPSGEFVVEKESSGAGKGDHV